jgi:hypothetical protein
MASSNASLRLIASTTAIAFLFALIRPAAAAEPPPPPDSDVRLIVQSDKPGTTIQRLSGTIDVTVGTHSGTGQLWTDLCVAPCDRTVAVGDQLRAAGPNIALSEPFVVANGKDVATVSVKTASQDARMTGGAFAALGTIAALTGLGLLIGASSMDPPGGVFNDPAFASINAQEASTANGMRTAGIVSLVLGGLGLVIGISTLSRNRTEVTVN